MDNNKLLQIFGTDELIKLFEELNNEVQTKIVSTSFRKGAKLIINEARSNLKGTYTHVYDSLGTSMDKDTQTLNVGSVMRKGGQLSHLINKGNVYRFTKSGGAKRGRIKPDYFWDRAMESTASEVEETIYKDIKESFEKLIRKNNKISR